MLHAFVRKSQPGKFYIDVNLENGYLILPPRFGALADYYFKHQPKNFYVLKTKHYGKISRCGYFQRCAEFVHFYDDEKLIL